MIASNNQQKNTSNDTTSNSGGGGSSSHSGVERIALVIGGSGFLGSHIVRALLQGCHHLQGFDEGEFEFTVVRSFDRIPFATTTSHFKEQEAEEAENEAASVTNITTATATTNAKTKPRFEEVIGDLRNMDDVMRACSGGVQVVFNTASMLKFYSDWFFTRDVDRRLVYDVNVKGARNVIEACKRLGIRRLIYTSTVNVVYQRGGAVPIRNGTEDLPYPDTYLDIYAKSKSIAERETLAANGTRLMMLNSAHDASANGGGGSSSSKKKKKKKAAATLRTCCIRVSGGIYGPGENMHFPRVISAAQSGLLLFNMGDPHALTDFAYVENLVHGHLLAAAKLLQQEKQEEEEEEEEEEKEEEKKKEAHNGNQDDCDHNDNKKQKIDVAGHVFTLSDGEPINNFEFFRPVIEALGYRYPTLWIPTNIMLVVAILCEITCWLLNHILFVLYSIRWCLFSPSTPVSARPLPPTVYPFLTRVEVVQVACDHYFSIEKAKKHLGYEPIYGPRKKAMDKTVAYYKRLLLSHDNDDDDDNKKQKKQKQKKLVSNVYRRIV